MFVLSHLNTTIVPDPPFRMPAEVPGTGGRVYSPSPKGGSEKGDANKHQLVCGLTNEANVSFK